MSTYTQYVSFEMKENKIKNKNSLKISLRNPG